MQQDTTSQPSIIALSVGHALAEYESKIWSTADSLRGAGFKNSDWPSLMMPFFALMLVESRIIRTMRQEIIKFEEALSVKFDATNPSHIETIDEAVKSYNYGYHPEIIKNGRTLASLCETQPHDFYSRLLGYVQNFDADTKKLLGVDYSHGSAKFLDLQGAIGSLNAKRQSDSEDILFSYTRKWASVDLTLANNSEVTTIEEHIKRKWADISAETAGEQYTPSDIIELATKVQLALAPIDPTGTWSVYDMTCGGGNFVFGVEDALRKKYPDLSVSSFGQEFNDQLYALAALEARFRPDAKIEYGNTLTNDRFTGKKFRSIVGNPPYGTDWKEFKPSIEREALAGGRFSTSMLPPTSDGQLLFTVHAASHLAENGIATIVHSGSTLFSGDAEGGESNIRKYLMADKDIVHAIIQLPKNLFFNTGINTYLWVLNNAKPESLKNKVMLINAESLFTKLKKSLNVKTCIVDEANQQKIINTLLEGVDNDFTKVVSVDDLLYNKIDLNITRTGDNGAYVKDTIKLSSEVNYIKIFTSTSDTDLETQVISGEPSSPHIDKESIKRAMESATSIMVETYNSSVSYVYDVASGIVLKDREYLGKGVLSIKALAPKKGSNVIRLDVVLSPLVEKDTEIVSYSSNPSVNDQLITDFFGKWIYDPYVVIGSKLGCEINFNKVFPKKVDVRSVKEVLDELSLLEKELAELTNQGGV